MENVQEASRDAEVDNGSLHLKKRPVFPIPAVGEGPKTYLLTCAQNNTELNVQVWNNMKALANHYDAEIFVASFTYNKATISSKGAKRKTAKETDTQEEWWASELTPYLLDESIEIAPGLVWCGELQILPTAVRPISGLESYTGRASSILPHVTQAVQSVPSPKGRGTKFVYTTGTVTLRNYIQKKAGQKAEFHHAYGCALVEVDSDGDWFVRQINADSEGVLYDFDLKVDMGVVTPGHRPEALVWGDIHCDTLEQQMIELAWGDGGILDALKPRNQVFHDLIDFRSQNHHDRDDPWKMFLKRTKGNDDVLAEFERAARFLWDAHRGICQSIVVCSNHDTAFVQWLKEGEFKYDPANAMFYLRATLAAYEAMERGDDSFYPVEWAFGQCRQGRGVPARFLRMDEEFIVCPDANGGIELGMHGHKGPNGGRGSLAAFAKSGRKSITGHSHTAGRHQGATVGGVMGSLDQGYNEGMSSWSNTNSLVYPNGKITLFTIWHNKWRAAR